MKACRRAGEALLRRYPAERRAWTKGDRHNVVTEADLASESVVIEALEAAFPDHSILSEERGLAMRDARDFWVIDPLDGTSNFVAGIPWFGVLLAHVRDGEADLSVVYLPCSDELYTAERGRGARRNGSAIAVSTASSLGEVLWAYGMDDLGSDELAREKLAVLRAVLRSTRNVRTTHSLVDPAYTADGRLGGMLNWSCRIWDVAAPSLLVREAGGLYTDMEGRPLHLDLSESAAAREYAVMAGAAQLHPRMRDLLARARQESSRAGPGPITSASTGPRDSGR